MQIVNSEIIFRGKHFIGVFYKVFESLEDFRIEGTLPPGSQTRVDQTVLVFAICQKANTSSTDWVRVPSMYAGISCSKRIVNGHFRDKTQTIKNSEKQRKKTNLISANHSLSVSYVSLETSRTHEALHLLFPTPQAK